jgi:hypothetical protein
MAMTVRPFEDVLGMHLFWKTQAGPALTCVKGFGAARRGEARRGLA